MLVPAMITLSAPTDKNLRTQVAETVSIIAGYDFPERWDNLIDVRIVALCMRPHLFPHVLHILLATARTYFKFPFITLYCFSIIVFLP